MSEKIEIEVVCKECTSELRIKQIEFENTWIRLIVEPCEDCLKAEYESGNDAGFDSGVESGYNDGIDSQSEKIDELEDTINQLREEIEELRQKYQEDVSTVPLTKQP